MMTSGLPAVQGDTVEQRRNKTALSAALENSQPLKILGRGAMRRFGKYPAVGNIGIWRRAPHRRHIGKYLAVGNVGAWAFVSDPIKIYRVQSKKEF